ncbi:MAG: hypothetical protein A3E83_06540 [Gammaproteobacteria bacterium RIFCSPHIGHO2_12_FULL_41_20]|nr:MAG: hypothetical protein A3E83_06540 [Gammaproteobacteria bacterium RIFCSPHIGHO2_12_FULL_41_20]
MFYDVTAPFNYTYATLQERALGGVEATVLRVAHALSCYHDVYIAQRGRLVLENQFAQGVHYVSLVTANQLHPDVVVLLRQSNWLERIGELFPAAQHYFWMHNLPPKNLSASLPALVKYGYEIIAVSQFHRKEIENRLRPWYSKFSRYRQASTPVSVIYNPIEDELVPDTNITWNPQQMISLCAPYKGLTMTLDLFDKVLALFPQTQLLVCYPYGELDKSMLAKNVQVLGMIAYYQMIQYVRSSFCVFYPQTSRVETFGLIYAQSNAVGTPVLAHDFGAASEVLNNPEQLVDGRDVKSVLDKLTAWHLARPIVSAKHAFRLSQVTQSWLQLLAPEGQNQ